MKNSIAISVIALSLFCASQSAMGNRSTNEAYTIAKKTLASPTVTLAEVATNGSDTLYYTYKGAQGGYAIVSAKEQTPTLLAYNKNQALSEKEAQHIAEFLECYYSNLDNLQLTKNVKKNADGLKLSKLTGCAIAPLMEDIAWGQREPYNQNTPIINGEKSPTGCVAIAIAQVLNYYKYPATVQTDIPQYTTKTNKLTISGTSKGTKLDWDNILNKYVDGYNETQAAAVANLIEIVGKSFNIDYKENESSSNIIGVTELPLYFGYDADLIKMVFRSSFTLEEWYEIIYNELKEKRPVVMTGTTMKSGHRFICDGLDENGLFHINWGWDSDFNGYYDLTVLNPNTTTQVGASSSKDGYSKDNYILIGITPDNGKKDKRTSTNVASVSVKYQLTNGYHYLFHSYTNPYATEETIWLASGYIDNNGEVVLVSSATEHTLEGGTKYVQESTSSLLTSKFENGKYYKVGLVESLDGTNWRPCEGFNNQSVTFTNNEGKVEVVNAYKLSAEIDVTDYNQVGTYAYGVIDLKNEGEKEYYGIVYLMTSPENVQPSAYSYAACVTVESENTNQMEVTFIPKADTTYYWILDKDMEVLKKGFVTKRNGTYNLSGKVQIDTLSNGVLNCHVYLTNSGDALFSGTINSTLLSNKYIITIPIELVIKTGATYEYTYKIDNTKGYNKYILSDINYNIINTGILNNGDEDGLICFNKYSSYATEGDSIYGFYIINNASADDFATNFKMTISKAGEDKRTEIIAKEIEIERNGLGVYFYKFKAIADTIAYEVFFNDTKSFHGKFLPTTNESSSELTEADRNICMEIDGQTLSVTAKAKTNLDIFTPTGARIVKRQLEDGETFSLTLKSGIYIVNGIKVIIR